MNKNFSELQVYATLEYFQSNGDGVVSVAHDSIGLIEFDIAVRILPGGLQKLSKFEVCLFVEGGKIVSHSVSPNAKIVPPTGASVGSQLSARVPQPPHNWNDQADVNRYDEQMKAFEKRLGVKLGSTRV